VAPLSGPEREPGSGPYARTGVADAGVVMDGRSVSRIRKPRGLRETASVDML